MVFLKGMAGKQAALSAGKAYVGVDLSLQDAARNADQVLDINHVLHREASKMYGMRNKKMPRLEISIPTVLAYRQLLRLAHIDNQHIVLDLSDLRGCSKRGWVGVGWGDEAMLVVKHSRVEKAIYGSVNKQR